MKIGGTELSQANPGHCTSVESGGMKALDTTAQVLLKNILFATDLSSAADAALPYAIEIARRYGSTVYAVHALQPDIYPLVPPSAWPTMAKQEEEFRQMSEERLETILRDLPHKVIFQRGDIWEVLSEVIQKMGIDLIVLGTHGRTGIQRALLGSVAEEIFRQARCPAMTVGPRVYAKSRRSAELNRILFATDFSPESLAAAPYAISLAREHRAQLILLHLVPDGNPAELKSLRGTLRELIPFGVNLRSDPDCIVERGDPGEKILEVSEGHGADLIVLGVRRAKWRLATTTHFTHSTAYKIVTEASCPVLTVRG